jgi:hypothetical protein
MHAYYTVEKDLHVWLTDHEIRRLTSVIPTFSVLIGHFGGQTIIDSKTILRMQPDVMRFSRFWSQRRGYSTNSTV